MTRARLGRLAILTSLLAAPAASLAAQQAAFPTVKVGGRLHAQAYYFDNDDYAAAVGPSSNFLLRRARFNAEFQITDRVSFTVMPSFESSRGRGDVRLRDAFIDVRLTDPAAPTSFVVRMGQDKRPFSRHELTSSNSLVAIERGAGAGLVSAASNDLFGKAGLLSHDIGVSAIVTSGAVTFHAGVFNGAGETARDPNDAKSFGARATVAATKKLNLGGSIFSHDGIVGADSSFRNSAFTVDGQWGKVGDAGLYALGEVMQGDGFSASKPTMRSFTGLLAYHVRRAEPGALLYAIEPAFRLDVADPDTDAQDDGSTLLTGVLGFYLSPKTQFRVAVERQDFQAGGARAITGVRTAMTVSF